MKHLFAASLATLATLGCMLCMPAFAAKTELEKTFSDELSIGQVFFPVVRSLESAGGDDAALYAAAMQAGYLTQVDVDKALARDDLIRPSTFQQCGVFTQKRMVWSHAQTKDAEEPLQIRTDPHTLHTSLEAEAALGKPQTPAERIRCMILYQSIVDRAVNLLGRSETSRIVRYDVGRKMTYALEDLSLRANTAFWLALIDPRSMRDAKFWLKFFAEGDQVCRVPTPTGLKAGKSEFSCGAFMMDQNAMVFVEGGRIFSDETVHGMYIKFAETIKPAAAQQQ
jgi:hypothetical protein